MSFEDGTKEGAQEGALPKDEDVNWNSPHTQFTFGGLTSQMDWWFQTVIQYILTIYNFIFTLTKCINSMIICIFYVIILSLEFYTLEREIYTGWYVVTSLLKYWFWHKNKNESSKGHLNIIYAMPYFVGVIEGTIRIYPCFYYLFDKDRKIRRIFYRTYSLTILSGGIELSIRSARSLSLTTYWLRVTGCFSSSIDSFQTLTFVMLVVPALRVRIIVDTYVRKYIN